MEASQGGIGVDIEPRIDMSLGAPFSRMMHGH
jgi:hypothetical protein